MIKENLIKDYIVESLKKYWELTAYTDFQKESFTYKDVATKIARMHIMFEENKIKKGDKIALLGKNSGVWAMTYLGIITYGAVVIPILPDFHPNEIHHIINHSESVALFVTEELWNKIDENEISHLRAIISLNDNKVLIQGNKEKLEAKLCQLDKLFQKKYEAELTFDKLSFPEISNDNLIAINYTSGSTGFSKGVMLTANNLAANIKFAWNNMRLDPEDKIVSILPLAHTFGCTFDFLWPFSKGVNVHFLTKLPTPNILLGAYKAIKPNLILSVPLIMEKIYKKQILPKINSQPVKSLLKIPGLSTVIYKKINKSLVEAFGGNFREVVLGGAPLNNEVDDFFRKMKFQYTIGYGMTECGPLISYSNWNITKPSSCGKLVDNMELKIDSKDPFNEVGEIMVKGEHVMQGYYKNEEATKQTIDKDGWLHTGDLGLTDSQNFVFIKGRSKSLILGPSGENIYPEEIESIINNKDYVQEALVIQKDSKIVALIYPDHELVDKNKVTDSHLLEIMEKIKLEVNQELPKYKQIAKVELYPTEFEKTPKKNIKRFLYQI
ncbi:MAG: AMP-binding protein [Bacteroidales bacterium]|nr:AMP-binding protein [Bacteroidales bacterium]